MIRGLSALTNGVVSACALCALGVVLGRAIEPSGADSAAPAEEPVADWAGLIAGGTPMGRPDAPVVLVTFSDFQCPYCARLAVALDSLRRREPSRFRVLYRHMPLGEIHPHAYAAALAAECAAAQGRFERMHDLLFERQPELGVLPWDRLAQEAGVADASAFERCMRANEQRDRILSDARLADSLGIEGTPTVFLDGKRLHGRITPERLDRLIEEALRSRRTRRAVRALPLHPLQAEIAARAVHHLLRDACDPALACVVGVDAFDHAAHERRHVAEPLQRVLAPDHAQRIAGRRVGVGSGALRERIGTPLRHGADRQLERLRGNGAPADPDAEAADQLRFHRIGQHRDLALARGAAEDGGHRPVARHLPLGKAHHLIARDAQELHGAVTAVGGTG